jgi:hypothetical protein
MKKYIIIGAVLVILYLFSNPIITYSTSEVIEVEVNMRDIKQVKDNDRKSRISTTKDIYMIYCEDETFTIEDELWYWQYSSSDLYGKLVPQKTYKIKVTGFRIPLFSNYRNIVKIID